MNFTITAGPRILFGNGNIAKLPALVRSFGSKALIITGTSSFIRSFAAMHLFQELEAQGTEFHQIIIEGEPGPEAIDDAVAENRNWQPSVVLAIGGGSVMDAGKAISAMLCEEGAISQYLEGVGKRQPSGRKIPLIAVPTTAGTGSEATKNAVITKQGENGYKKSLRHEHYVPDIALVDPELTVSCPPFVTAASGMDAFTQLLEAFLSDQSNAYTDTLALDGMTKLVSAIEKAVAKGDDTMARSAMSYAALVSGIALANAGLGVVHGFAQPLGSFFSVPHGVVCGTLMGPANRITVEIAARESNWRVLDKYYRVAQLISRESDRRKAIDELLKFIEQLSNQFELPLLSDFNINRNDLPLIIQHTGLKNHPVQLNEDDLLWILQQRMR
ncbi:iron-containing alcohol dehydrogenase [Roseimarinus sediminis]|uniref:iron-containing alcohol dehydrogenase n=1 Tax=Roseimarinus sediminis TaxID=1610899 RepID=UPI003D1B90D7